MNVPNYEKKAFRDMTPEERSVIVEEALKGNVECLHPLAGWYQFMDTLHFTNIYRTRQRKLTIPWEHIKPEYKWATLHRSGNVMLWQDKPSLIADEWYPEDGFYPAVVNMLYSLDINTTGIGWRESLTARPEGI